MTAFSIKPWSKYTKSHLPASEDVQSSNGGVGSAKQRLFAHLDCFQVTSALANVFEDLAVRRGTNE